MIDNIQKHTIISDRVDRGLTLNQLAQKHHKNRDDIKSLLVESGNYRDTRHNHSINEWRYDFFDDNSPSAAYWAGFGFADGCVRMYRYTTRYHIIICERDHGHIEMFANEIGFPVSKIRVGKNSRTIAISRNNKTDFLSSLRRWGIVERKSYNFVEPDIYPDLIPHFMRGWFDGDGHIDLGKRNQKFEIVGNFRGIEWGVEQFRMIGFSGHITVKHTEGKVWGRLYITGANQIRDISEMLGALEPTNPMIQRKWLPVIQRIS